MARTRARRASRGSLRRKRVELRPPPSGRTMAAFRTSVSCPGAASCSRTFCFSTRLQSGPVTLARNCFALVCPHSLHAIRHPRRFRAVFGSYRALELFRCSSWHCRAAQGALHGTALIAMLILAYRNGGPAAGVRPWREGRSSICMSSVQSRADRTATTTAGGD